MTILSSSRRARRSFPIFTSLRPNAEVIARSDIIHRRRIKVHRRESVARRTGEGSGHAHGGTPIMRMGR